MRRYLPIFFALLFYPELSGQTVTENLSGKVSFVSSQNIYVKFKSTSGMSVGDTLYIPSDEKLIPVLIVKNLSSTSCVCLAITSESLPPDHLIIARVKISTASPSEKPVEKIITVAPGSAVSDTSAKRIYGQNELKQKISGSISVNSYSDLSNTIADNSQRFRYTFSIDANNIADSKFSAESYISFRHKLGDWAEVQSNVFNALKIYNLAVKYEPDKTTQIILGRKINPKISSIGSIDGLQAEKALGKFAFGAIAGSRPDYATYGFNFKLFQFGGYMAFNTRSEKTYSESSLAFMQQMNNWKTDRRFLYFQHSSSLIKNIYLFSTFEIDLFKLENDLPKSTFDLTGLYFSLRYRISKGFSLTGSYDSRKNVMYYETYKTYFDRVLETEMRQSYRLQANLRITKDLMFGLQTGYRFLKSDPHPSKNVYGYLTYSRIPGLNISATLSGTYLETSYTNGKIFGLSISRDLFQGKLQTSLGYRFVDYTLPENKLREVQNIGEMNLSWLISKNLFFSVNYEGTFEKQDKYNRIYLQLRKRF
jgi:hypothetical protein